MADISWARRMDAITGGAIVLTVDAVVFLMTALIGAPFLLFFMADGDDPAGPIWPIATVWAVSAVLGSASAAAAFLIGARGTQRIRQAGATTALATATATAGLVVTYVSSSPVLAMVGALFAAANLGAAKLLFTPEPAVAALPAPGALPEVFLLAAPLAEAEVRTRETVEIQVREPVPALEPSPEPEFAEDDAEVLVAAGVSRPRRPRGPAALHSLTGVRLPPRALRASARGRGSRGRRSLVVRHG